MAKRVFAVLRCFSRLRDPRGSRRETKHVFLDIIAITLCAVIAGADDWGLDHRFEQGQGLPCRCDRNSWQDQMFR